MRAIWPWRLRNEAFYDIMVKEVSAMRNNVPRGKLSKARRRDLDRQKRVTWDFSPVARAVESKKAYTRKPKRPWKGDEDSRSRAV